MTMAYACKSIKSTLIRQCPDEWIQNNMPSVSSEARANEYFIINGERKELKDYDMQWIKKHCNIEKTVVH